LPDKAISQHTDDAEMRQLITDMIKRCPKKRDQIAAEMSALLRHRITVHMLNAFTSDSRKWSRFPAAWLQAFSEVVSDDRLERYVISKRNRDVLEFGEAAITVISEAAREKLVRRHKDRSQAQPSDDSQTALPLTEPK
jgi:hypothetical protein